MNLLVIEDDRKLNRMLCEILEKEGYTVKACTDGCSFAKKQKTD